MGTRGIWGFITKEGDLKATYNHFDSYPSGLGVAIQKVTKTWDAIPADDLLAIRFVDEDEAPTLEECQKYAHLSNTDVSTGTDWYSLLREMQGNLGLALTYKIAVANHDFPRDSLFCEWGYVFDLRSNEVVILEGFNEDRSKEAPYCRAPDGPREGVPSADKYCGCAEVWRGSLAEWNALDLTKFEEMAA